MSNISKSVLESRLVNILLEDLTPDEVKEFESYVEEFIQPLDSLSFLVKDMMSTDSTREKLAEDIIKMFTKEGLEELEKCLEKN